MASELFLSRFCAKNFRSLGSVDIAIPAEPGVVVLEGPNGLGKTTFFEAIEVALTGSVFRWEDIGTAHKVKVKELAQRIHSGDGPCRVDVEFTGVDCKENATWSKLQEHVPALWLCERADAWGLDGNRLPNFLRGTHVLTQSPHLRLLHLSAEERWDKVLSNVSGYSDIDSISKALNEVDGTLTLKCKEAANAVATAKKAAENWVSRIAELRSRESAERAGGASFSPSAARALLDVSDQNSDVPADTAEGANAELDYLAGLVVGLRSDLAEASMDPEVAEELRAIPVEWSAARVAMRTAAEALDARRTEESVAAAALKQTFEDIEQRKVQSTSLESVLQSSRSRLAMARDAIQLQSELMDAIEASTTARERQMQCVNEVERAREIVSTLAMQLAARRKWETQGAALEARARDLDSARAAWVSLQEIRARLAECAANGHAADEQRTARTKELAIEEAEFGSLDRRLAAEQERAEAARSETSALKGLLAELIGHVRAGDTTCPVCRAEYPATGELLARATTAQAEEDASLARLETALREARSATETQRQRVVVVRQALSVVEASLASIQQQQTELRLEEANLRSRIAACDAGREQEVIQSLADDLDDEQWTHRRDESSALPSETLIERELREKTDILQEAEACLRAADDNGRQIAGEVANGNARCALIGEQLNIAADSLWTTVEEGFLREQVEAELEFARASGAVETARNAKEAADRKAHLAMQATATAEAISLDAASAVAALERRWTMYGLDLPPSSEGFGRELERLESLKRALERRIEGANSAVAGIQRWLELEQLQNARQCLDDEAGQSGPEGWEAHGAALQQAIVEKESEERLAIRASTAVKAMKEEAGKSRLEMREALTTRLTPFLKPLLETLLVNREVAKSTLELSEFRRRTQVAAVMDGNIPLVAVASEGQLAGVNLAIQLAMAQAFPWSRWRALLLDDPSQFSDVVHSSSLIETLRALARRKRFQIILSTHDRDFAKYVCGKFANEGLSTTRIAFRQPPSDGGIVPRVVSSWKPPDKHETATG